MNKYNINDKLFYYDSTRNTILEITVFAVTFNPKQDKECKYNYLYPESKLYSEFSECFKAARETIKKNIDELTNELKNKCNMLYGIPNNEEGGM